MLHPALKRRETLDRLRVGVPILSPPPDHYLSGLPSASSTCRTQVEACATAKHTTRGESGRDHDPNFHGGLSTTSEVASRFLGGGR